MPNVTKEITTTTTQKMIFAFKSHQSGVAQTTEHIFSKMFLINFFRAKVNLLFSGPRSKLLSEGTLSVSNICSRKSGPGRPLNASNSSQNCPLWVVRNNRTRFNKTSFALPLFLQGNLKLGSGAIRCRMSTWPKYQWCFNIFRMTKMARLPVVL